MQSHKTKIVCTIGPASRGREVMKGLMLAGMNVARLNFSHGDLEGHAADIRAIREIAGELGLNVAILADLPGPKIRIGILQGGACTLVQGERVVLTERGVEGSASLIPVQLTQFSSSVQPGDRVFLNDGFIKLKVESIKGEDVTCEVVIGGQLLSKKGMNLPDSDLHIDAMTERDQELLVFGMDQGVDMFGISFVGNARDLEKARAVARKKGKGVFLIAKIERPDALHNIDDIIRAADGIMVARGDLGVEIPIEEVPIVQKQLIHKANLASKPVITATQVLESMTGNTRPTRAEVTDAANAVFDGTDALMLSEESAMGKYPVDACAMLTRIASCAEKNRVAVVSGRTAAETVRKSIEDSGSSTTDVITLDAVHASVFLGISSVVVPTRSGLTARSISRFKGEAWVIALCRQPDAVLPLCLSYGVLPVMGEESASDEHMIAFLVSKGIISSFDPVILVKRDPFGDSRTAHSMKIVTPGAYVPSGQE